MTAHAKGPWVTGSVPGMSTVVGISQANQGKQVAFVGTHRSKSAESKADAARIVECVNACEGINPAFIAQAIEAMRETEAALAQYAGLVKNTNLGMKREKLRATLAALGVK